MTEKHDTEWTLKPEAEKAPAKPKPTASSKADSPAAFSTYMPRDIAKRLRFAAVEAERPVWELVTEAVAEWLDRQSR